MPWRFWYCIFRQMRIFVIPRWHTIREDSSWWYAMIAIGGLRISSVLQRLGILKCVCGFVGQYNICTHVNTELQTHLSIRAIWLEATRIVRIGRYVHVKSWKKNETYPKPDFHCAFPPMHMWIFPSVLVTKKYMQSTWYFRCTSVLVSVL